MASAAPRDLDYSRGGNLILEERYTDGTKDDTALTDVNALYVQHADTLRWPAPAKLCTARIVPWLQGHKDSEARVVAAKIVRDMRPEYEAATINRSLAAPKKGLLLTFDAGLTSTNQGLVLAQVRALALQGLQRTQERFPAGSAIPAQIAAPPHVPPRDKA